MEIKNLKTFLSVAKLKNFSAAAKERNTVQPTVSRHISDLENALNVKLFIRTTHQVELTAAGEALVKEAVSIIANDNRVKILLGQIENNNETIINIGYLSTACSFFLPKLISEYSVLNDNVTIALHEMTVEEQYQALIENKIDLAFSRRKSKLDRQIFNIEEVYSDQPMVVLPLYHPLATRCELTIKELSNEKFILFPSNDWPDMHEHFHQLCQENGFSPNITFNPNNMRHLVMSVASGLGCSIVPSCTRFISDGACVFIPIYEINLKWPLYLYYKQEEVNPSITEFIDCCIKELPNINTVLRR